MLLTAAILLQSFAQKAPDEEISGSGRIVTVKRDLQGFSGLNVSSGITLYVRQGDKFSVEVESNQSVIPYLETKVDRGVLYIRIKAHTVVKKAKTLNAYVTLPRITELTASGNAQIELDNKIKGERIYGSITVNSLLRGHIDCDKLELRGTGSSLIEIEGSVSSLMKLRLSSGTEFDCYDLKVKDLNIEASSDCVARITVSGDMRVNVGSGAKFLYKGPGKIVQKKIAESGTVRHT